VRVVTTLLATGLMTGCVSQKPADYLVPALHGVEASLVVDAALCSSAAIVSTSQLLMYSDEHKNLYLRPPDEIGVYCQLVRMVPKGTVLTNVRALHVNLFDSSHCLLRFRLAGESKFVHISDHEIQALLGFAPQTPKSRSWICSR
jgi:hypothetical protein